jgi:diaminopimelate epimerase
MHDISSTLIPQSLIRQVSFVQSLDCVTNENFAQVGPAISRHIAFPGGTNAEVAQVIDRCSARMLVWERGAGRTLACGTGACAVVVAGVLNGLLDPRCTVHLDGGQLDIEWDRDGSNDVFKTGPAREVFNGTLDLSILSAA